MAQSAALDVESTTQGFLLPRMTEAQRDAITAPEHALIIYQTDADPGFYYNEGTSAAPLWRALSSTTNNLCETRVPIDALPFTITASGSYYVTENLTAPSNLNGIIIQANNVTIDLNGFTLTGGGGASGNGIYTAAAQNNLSIFNGHITDWGDDGINFRNSNSIVLNEVHIRNTQGDGIDVGDNSRIINCSSIGNAYDGIEVNHNSIVMNSIAANNSDDGIETNQGCTINGCVSRNNGDEGIYAGTNNIISHNSVTINSDRGIVALAGTTLKGNVSSNNIGIGIFMFGASLCHDNTAVSNGSHGYAFNDECFIHDNIARSNSGSGYYSTGSNNSIKSNQSNNNSVNGFDFQGGTNSIITHNTATNNSINNYSISGGNQTGPIIGAGLSTTNPFANIGL